MLIIPVLRVRKHSLLGEIGMIFGNPLTKTMIFLSLVLAAEQAVAQDLKLESSRRIKQPPSTVKTASLQLTTANPETSLAPRTPKPDLNSQPVSSRRIGGSTKENIDKIAGSVLSDKKDSGQSTTLPVADRATVKVDLPPPIPATPTAPTQELKPLMPLPASSVLAPILPESNQPSVRVASKPEPIQPRKRLPKLADPEQFRVTREHFGDSSFVPAQTAVASNGYSPSIPSRFQDKDSLLDQLPVPSLDGNLKANPLQRATDNRRSDPFMTFANSASLALDYRMQCQPAIKTWRTPNMSHRPIYFEDENLERYGIGFGHWQPLASGFKFFTEAALLPYQVGARSPMLCEYEMGYYRPGDCVPAYRPGVRFSKRGMFYQAATFGVIFGGL